MEILILGGILVVIMVIVSTKIKKNAAAAFEQEFIEKEDFSIEKPAGFLYPLRDEPDFPFEAYSKLYGDKYTRNIWRARSRLRIFENTNIKDFVSKIKTGSESVESTKEFDDLPEGQKGVIVRSSKTEDEIDYKILRKIVATNSNQKIYELKTTILEPYGEEFTDKTCEMMRSFVVK